MEEEKYLGDIIEILRNLAIISDKNANPILAIRFWDLANWLEDQEIPDSIKFWKEKT